MLGGLILILVGLWLLGVRYALGPFVHLLLVVALVIFVIRLLQGRTDV